jgi:predicted Zn finger-like uncharacterized protein
MALVTRCPNCGTAFRVTPFHLQAHAGDVRCGRCAKIFNGFSTLATMQEPEAAVSATTEAVRSSPVETPVDASETTPDTVPVMRPEGIPEPRFGAAPEATPEATPKPDPESAPRTDTVDSEADLEQLLSQREDSNARSHHENLQAEPLAEASAAQDASPAEPYISGWRQAGESAETAPHSEGLRAPEPNDTPRGAERGLRENYAFDAAEPSVSPLWGVASLFLLMLLAAQMVYFYRNDIVDTMPAAKPLLDQYCKLLGCTVQPPLRPELLNIESSEMRMDIQDSSKIILNATVRNYAPYPLAFPSFEVTLTDSRDEPIASRVFSPDSYLDKNEIRPGAVGPDYEFNVRLHLDSSGLSATGYRLSLIYPSS